MTHSPLSEQSSIAHEAIYFSDQAPLLIRLRGSIDPRPQIEAKIGVFDANR